MGWVLYEAWLELFISWWVWRRHIEDGDIWRRHIGMWRRHMEEALVRLS
jgi:hypothetical protein